MKFCILITAESRLHPLKNTLAIFLSLYPSYTIIKNNYSSSPTYPPYQVYLVSAVTAPLRHAVANEETNMDACSIYQFIDFKLKLFLDFKFFFKLQPRRIRKRAMWRICRYLCGAEIRRRCTGLQLWDRSWTPETGFLRVTVSGTQKFLKFWEGKPRSRL